MKLAKTLGWVSASGLLALSVFAQTDAPRTISINLKPEPEISVPTNDVRHDAVVDAVRKVMPSVVNIATKNFVRVRDWREELYDQYFGRQSTDTPYSLGSGVIIDEDGYLLTNDHVVQRADQIQVMLAGGGSIYTAKVIARDNQNDIALLKLDAPPGEKFTAIIFADDDDLLLGETVLALGNPFNLGGSVSRGILSSKSRVMPKPGEPLTTQNCLQTDAAINPGNSGGPLVNLHGELIGLNAIVLPGAQNIGFAIPVKQVVVALANAFTPESVKQLWFGAHVKAGGGPLVVTSVQDGSPAAIGGLKVGDTIVKVNGKSPKGFVEFNELLANTPDTNAALAVLRNGAAQNVNVRLVPEKDFFNAELIQKRLGVKLQPVKLSDVVPAQMAGLLGLNSSVGFLVTEVEAKSPAAASLARGAVITAIDGQPPADVIAIAKLLHAKSKGDVARVSVVVQQTQGSQTQFNLGVLQIPVR